MPNIVEVPFEGDSVVACEREDGVFVPVKPLCERLGISWQMQHRKFRGDPALWGVIIMMMPSAGGQQEMACIPVNRVAAWLFTVNPGKVRPELRAKVAAYRARCADVLDRHFRLRAAASEAVADAVVHQHRQLAAAALAFNPLWNKVARLAEAGVPRGAVWRHFPSRRQGEVWEAIEAVERLGCGVAWAPSLFPARDATPLWVAQGGAGPGSTQQAFDFSAGEAIDG